MCVCVLSWLLFGVNELSKLWCLGNGKCDCKTINIYIYIYLIYLQIFWSLGGTDSGSTMGDKKSCRNFWIFVMTFLIVILCGLASQSTKDFLGSLMNIYSFETRS